MSQRIANLRRRVNRARKFPANTCPASRHLHIMADDLLRYGHCHQIAEEPEHCAESMLAVLEALWKARGGMHNQDHLREIARLRGLLAQAVEYFDSNASIGGYHPPPQWVQDWRTST